MYSTYRGDKERVGRFVKKNKGVGASEVAKHEACRVWGPVPKRLVCLNHQNNLVSSLGEAVLLPQAPQVF